MFDKLKCAISIICLAVVFVLVLGGQVLVGQVLVLVLGDQVLVLVLVLGVRFLSLSWSLGVRSLSLVLVNIPENNNMKIHPSQMKELVVTQARSRSMPPPSQPFIEGTEIVTTLKVLGVLLNFRLTTTDHVSQVLNTCSSS